MTNVVGIIQARMESKRLPGKVLKTIHGHSFLSLIISRLHRCTLLNNLVVAVPDNSVNEVIKEHLYKLNVECVLGSENNLVKRYKKAADLYEADYIVRITADCPFVDPEVIDNMVTLIKSSKLDFITNVYPPSWPDGLDISVFSRKTLDQANHYAKLDSEKEHVVPWMWKNSNLTGVKRLKAYNFPAPYDLSSYRWTLDTKSDLSFFKKISLKLSWSDIQSMNWREFIKFFIDNSSIVAINSENNRDDGYLQSLSKEK